MIDVLELIADVEESQSYVRELLDDEASLIKVVEQPVDMLNQINTTLEKVRQALGEI